MDEFKAQFSADDVERRLNEIISSPKAEGQIEELLHHFSSRLGALMGGYEMLTGTRESVWGEPLNIYQKAYMSNVVFITRFAKAFVSRAMPLGAEKFLVTRQQAAHLHDAMRRLEIFYPIRNRVKELGPVSEEQIRWIESMDASLEELTYSWNLEFSEAFQRDEYFLHNDITDFWSRFGRRGTGVYLGKPHFKRIRTSADYVRYVVDPLVNNCLDHAFLEPQDDDPEIWIGMDRNGHDEATVIVDDNGCGYPDELIPTVFDRGTTTRGDADGHGLGLYHAKRFVEENGGRIWAENRNPGFKVSFTMPCEYEVVAPIERHER